MQENESLNYSKSIENGYVFGALLCHLLLINQYCVAISKKLVVN